MPSPVTSATTAMKTTSVGATSKARPPAGRKATDIAAVIKATESAGMCTWLGVKRRVTASVEGIAVVEIAMVKVAAIEVVAGEVVAIDDGSAVGNVGVVVVDHGPTAPVVPPVAPTPSKSSEEADSKSKPEGDSGHGVPAWVADDRRPVHEPRIIGRHVDHVRVGWFDDDGAALSRHLLLF